MMVILFLPFLIGWDDDGWVCTRFYVMLSLMYIVLCELVCLGSMYFIVCYVQSCVLCFTCLRDKFPLGANKSKIEVGSRLEGKIEI